MDTATNRHRSTELWMELTNLKLLQRLMAIQGVSARKLADAAGWESHSYMNRLLAGQVKTLKTDPAVRIAAFLGVPTDVLFVTRVSSDFGQQNAPRRKSA